MRSIARSRSKIQYAPTASVKKIPITTSMATPPYFDPAAAPTAAAPSWLAMSRNDTICSDGKVPLQQRDLGLGQVQYKCQDGELVNKP